MENQTEVEKIEVKYDILRLSHEMLHQNFQQLRDEMESLTKNNDILWKVIAMLMEKIDDGKR